LFMSLSVMFWGFLWRRALVDKQEDARRFSKWLLSVFLVIVPPICLLAYNKDFGFQETWYRYTLSYFTAILLFIAGTTNFKIDSKITSYLGRISYSVYLLGELGQKVGETVLQNIPGMPLHVGILISMATTILAASIVYRLIEAPSITLGRTISKIVEEKMARPWFVRS